MREKKKSNFADKVVHNTKHQKESNQRFGYLDLPKGISLLKFEEDTRDVELDIIPYNVTDEKHPDRDPDNDVAMPGTLWYRRPIKTHVVGTGSDRETIICPKSIGKKCPICDYQEKRRKEGADKEEIKTLYPRSRSLYAVIPLGVKGTEEKVYLWDMSDYLFQNLLNEEIEIDPTNAAFPALEDGKTLKLRLRWTSIGKDSKPFPEVRSIRFEDRDPYKESILDEVPNLDEILKILPYEKIEAKFFELEDEPDAGPLTKARDKKDEDDAPPVRSRHRETKEKEDDDPPPRRRREEEEETKPTRSRRDKEDDDDPPVRKKEDEKLTRRERSSSSPECPHGHKFGVDVDKKEFANDCDSCKVWDQCIDKKEGK